MNTLSKNNYHPVLFSEEVKYPTPKPVTLYGKKYVVWRSESNNVHCLEDKCSHRSAKLSQGVVVDKCIQCPYHGWQYNKHGKCVVIPQMPKSAEGKPIPRSTKVPAFKAVDNDGIIWINTATEDIIPFSNASNWLNNDKYLVTDLPLTADYSYLLQIENLLDPAHIHFVHNGFQGNAQSASHINVTNISNTDDKMSALFQHENRNVPDLFITFHKPYVVDVSILNKEHDIVRKNIIYVSPIERNKCKVLFRDVVVKKFITPKNNEFMNILVNHLAKGFITQHYQLINNKVVNSIMQQDIDVLCGQGENITTNYFDHKYIMPTESDRLIVEFRKWAKTNRDWLADV